MKNMVILMLALCTGNQLMGQTAVSNRISCSEKAQKETVVKTCTWSVYKSVSSGEADNKGRYFYTYQMYKSVNGKYVKVENSQLFNEKGGELLVAVNRKIKEFYSELSKDLGNADCLSEIEGPKDYTFDDLDIFIDKGGFTFSYSFGLSSACLAIDGDFITYTISEIEPYLKK